MRSTAAFSLSTVAQSSGCRSRMLSNVKPEDLKTARSKLAFVRAPVTAALSAPKATTTSAIRAGLPFLASQDKSSIASMAYSPSVAEDWAAPREASRIA